MELQELKLVGFKSFVDSTTIPLPGHLIGVVGPNGCGKSNVIDAVRWVLGEISAKNLRGESMSDVIFNGSSTRKPVGKASVELVFDNSCGTLGGEFAKYSVVSVKREVSRDGQSTYFINGTVCRRKDVTDLFLGTGLGPRSYSIIEQGMISRLIEAAPQELRIHLEEAAGTSKYKERRRETETRIKHTRENLERLTDLRDELEKQLDRLNRQARAAEKYKEFRDEERQLKAQLLALRWQTFNELALEQDKLISDLELQVESFITEQTHYSSQIEIQREQLVEQRDHFNEAQSAFYRSQAAIVRLEEAIANANNRRQQMQLDLEQAQTELSRAQLLLEQDQKQITEHEQTCARIEPEWEIAKQQLDHNQSQLQNAEAARSAWQQEWDNFNQTAAKSSQHAHVEQTRIQQIESRIAQHSKRLENLYQEKSQLHVGDNEIQLAQVQEQQEHYAQQLEQRQQDLSDTQSRMQQQRSRNQELQDELDECRDSLQQLNGQRASLNALQQTALGQQNSVVADWLISKQLDQSTRLAQGIRVNAPWEKAVETVLGEHLQAVCVAGIDAVCDLIASLENGSVSFIDTQNGVAIAQISPQSLAQQVQCEWPATQQLLAHVHCAPTLSQAIALAKTLRPHESVITPEGIWIGPGWLRVSREQDEKAGIFARQQQLLELSQTIDEASARVEEVEQQLENGRDVLLQIEEQRELQQQQVNEIKQQIAESSANARVLHNKIEQITQRIMRIDQEIAEIKTNVAQCETEMATARTQWEQAMQAMENDADRRQNLVSTRDQLQAQLDSVRGQNRQLRDSNHEFEMQISAAKTQLTLLRSNVVRLQEQLSASLARRDSLSGSLAQLENPQGDLQSQLNDALQSHTVTEHALAQSRNKVETSEEKIRESENARQHADHCAREIQMRIQQAQLDAQSHKVRRATIEEQVVQMELVLSDLIATLSSEAREPALEEELQRIAERIARLGPINLAAIDEYKVESERKQFLDAQNLDLTNALETLENAIRKIDRETRQRFKETYDFVNQTFQEIFPRLFGGGAAYLELTGEDLLDTGVAVIARPPGKKNNSVHQLSGGEKAMTAVALVFAIFQLNPSPFCLLDEVDAPLDEANVTRFCNLVRQMSEKTQFIFITHNKVTMELATNLLGVTMHEPGVSRLVSVNIDEAVSLTTE